MKKILCPVDFSPRSLNAVNYAAKITKALDGELTLFFVQSLWSFTPADLPRGTAMRTEMAIGSLEELAADVTRKFKVSCFAVVKTSAALLSAVLAEEAKNFNLVVMGSDGEKDFFHKVLGSDAYRLIQASNVPVLLVPDGTTYQQITDIVYAADYLKDHHIAMTQLIVLAKALGCRLMLVQVVEPGCPSAERHDLDEFQRSLKQLYAEDVPIQFETIQSTKVTEVLNAKMEKSGADVLALCTRHHRMMEHMVKENIVREITVMAHYPVLVFHQ